MFHVKPYELSVQRFSRGMDAHQAALWPPTRPIIQQESSPHTAPATPDDGPSGRLDHLPPWEEPAARIQRARTTWLPTTYPTTPLLPAFPPQTPGAPPINFGRQRPKWPGRQWVTGPFIASGTPEVEPFRTLFIAIHPDWQWRKRKRAAHTPPPRYLPMRPEHQTPTPPMEIPQKHTDTIHRSREKGAGPDCHSRGSVDARPSLKGLTERSRGLPRSSSLWHKVSHSWFKPHFSAAGTIGCAQ